MLILNFFYQKLQNIRYFIPVKVLSIFYYNFIIKFLFFFRHSRNHQNLVKFI
ncbi:hypothetical protein M153_7345000807 [Pseudoloma neurophilia]|uniref:Uncharacterized protein n=1 Tax=Pseudoloma neurophilia TaxID=146866 RepID=A0A0R0LYN0_9MICR|nr:hypothetical protein M153_7345000807 [Pseudoloma neurophilia]